ncbi:site-specific integrase [Azotosporobacter soli]|uniref:tyrosine-type recombinase/integrase n=1 Tax=Azotosporobacter soli TaxID=3055040 RepID=UPI0031FF23A0
MFKKKNEDVLFKVKQEFDFALLAEEFILMREAEVSKFTVGSIRNTLKQFLAFCDGTVAEKGLKLKVLQFLAGKGNEHYNKQLQAIRGFFRYCVEEGQLSDDPCISVKYKPHTSRIVQHNEEVIRRLLDAPNKATWAGLRDYTAMVLFLDTGVRPNELVQIKLGDFDFGNGYLYLRESITKTRQKRTVPLSPICVSSIKRLIHCRHKEWDSEYVFCSWRGEEITTGELRDRFRNYSKEIGTNITPYHLRHTFALYFLRNSSKTGVFALQKIMGHSKLEQTRNYVSLLEADIQQAHQTASPISNMLGAIKGKATVIKL